MKKLYTLLAAAMMTAASASATTWGVIGAFNDWSGDVEMEQVSDNIYQVTMESLAGQFKLRADHDWSWNYGAGVKVTENMTFQVFQNGDNINIPGEATDVTIVLDVEAETVSISGTFDAANIPDEGDDVWSVIGAFNGWEDDVDMKKIDDSLFTVDLFEFEGEFKFRLNHEWGTNLGGVESYTLEFGSSYPLTGNGANLNIPGPADVTFVLDTAANTVFVAQATTVVEKIESADSVEYFNLNGVRVANPRGGIFIRVQDGKASKVAVR